MIFCITYLFFIIILSNNPYFLLFILFFTTIYCIFSINHILLSQWFSYLILLILIGGLLIMFLYMVSLIPKELYNIRPLSIFMITLLILFINFNNHNNNFNIQSWNGMEMTPHYMFMYPSIMFFSIMYLLFTLFSSIHLTNSKMGPLRLL